MMIHEYVEFTCDICQKPINKLADGVLLMQFDEKDKDETIIVHIGKCAEEVSKEYKFTETFKEYWDRTNSNINNYPKVLVEDGCNYILRGMN